MVFEAEAVAIQLIEALRPIVPRVKARDRALADQLVRAAGSVALNIAEGNYSDPATETISITPLAADASHIDVEWTDSRRNPCEPSFDCTSDRVLHFRWLRACSPDDHSLEKCP